MILHRSTPSTIPRTYDIAQIRGIVESLSFPRVFGSDANKNARDIICSEFSKIFGEKPTIIGDTKNIIMGDPETASIVVGAHYDSVPNTPGADDNASAVASMLHIAQNINLSNVCFVAFNGEECGLLGSREFVKSYLLDSLEQTHILEMVGYRTHEPNSQENPLSFIVNDLPTVGDFIGAITITPHLMKIIMEHSNSINVPVIGLTVPIGQGIGFNEIEKIAPHLLRSDHAPFWESRHPAVMWTDTAEFRNKNYHKPTDTPDTLDYDFMVAVSDLITNIIKGNNDDN
jgi:Zn-dependent M28 family amino/carboxypeptidase